MKDILGQEIKVGDIVAHGQRSGNSGCITIKLVTELRKNKKWNSVIDEVKVIGYARVTHEWRDRKWVDVEPHYKMNDRGGWTTPSVLIVINDAVPKDVKDFLQGQLHV